MKVSEANAGLVRQIRIQTWIIGTVGLVLVCANAALLFDAVR